MAQRTRVRQTRRHRRGDRLHRAGQRVAATDDPAGLQRICDTLGPGTIRVFCERWWARLPLPLTEADRAAGYWWDIAMRQVEVSRTVVFDAPRHARGFFEALCADNLDIGRPEEMQLIFGRRVRTPPPGGYRTRLLRSGDEVTLGRLLRALPGEVPPGGVPSPTVPLSCRLSTARR